MKDETGEITLNFWREQVGVGDSVGVIEGFVKLWRGRPELNTFEVYENPQAPKMTGFTFSQD